MKSLLRSLALIKFHHCTKEHLIVVAAHFGVTVSKNLRKQVIKSELWSVLSERGVLPCENEFTCWEAKSGRHAPL